MLSDIASQSDKNRDEIILAQVECLTTLTNVIRESKERGKIDNTTAKIYLCRSTVPALIGICRAMGRFCTSDPPLLCRLFPKPEHPLVDKLKISDELKFKKSNFTHYRSIMPRSLSGGNDTPIQSQMNLDALSDIAYSTDSLKKAKLLRNQNIHFDSSRYFFAKYGSSFNQFPYTRLSESPEKKSTLIFSINNLQAILAIAKKLLTKEMLEYLDEQAAEVYDGGKILVFPYKSFSETMNLVMVTLLRELLQNQKNLPTPFTKDVQEFVKGLFLNGQTELQSRNHDASEKEDRDTNFSTVNKFKVNVMANAACVDLLVWAIGDETGIYLFIKLFL